MEPDGEMREGPGLPAAVVRSSHDAIVVADLDGTILSWNPAAERLYGRRAADVVGRPAEELIPLERRGDEAEICAIVAAGGRVDRYRSARIHRDGHPVDVSILVSPLHGPDGAITGVTTVARAVSQRERAEAQLQAVLDATPDALLGVDERGRVVLVNRQAERLFGRRRFELEDLPVERLLPGGLSRPTISVGAGDGPVTEDTRQRTARRYDGTELPVETALSALRTDSGPIVMVAIRDVTERIVAQAEQQRLREEADRERLEARLQRTQRLESLGQLAGGVAHDFNNLLAVILNYAAFIIEDAAGTAMAADAEQIARAGRRGSELTHQLLAFARREVIRPRALDVNAAVRDVQQMLSRSIGEHIALTTHLARWVPPVMADPGQLEQVLVNLAVNARDAMPAGGRLGIDTAVHDTAAGRFVRVAVTDTGTGMPAEVVDRAFDPFFTTKPSGEGTGLGLATVYGIITQAGGTVTIDSAPGHGTTINVLLPATAEALPDAEAGPAERGLHGHGQTVLVVEDEAALRQVTARILRRAGYTVIVAEDGATALKLAEEHPEPIDVLLTDVVMPGMVGTEVAARLAADRPRLKVLFMSGYAQPVLASHGTLDPDVCLIEKPFTGTELLRAVHDQLR
jgi:PAS domain S-box-containing protein